MPITVIAIDDHFLIREGIRSLLAGHPDVQLVAEGWAGEHLLHLVQVHSPDIVLLDLGLPATPQAGQTPPFQAFPALATLAQNHPRTRVIIVSQHDSPTLVEGAIELGVRGYLLKYDALTQQLVEAIRVVHRGGAYFSTAIWARLQGQTSPSTVHLSPRQQEILWALAIHPDYSQARHARQLGISENTLKQHLRHIYRALGATNLTSAILKALQAEILPWTLLHSSSPPPSPPSYSNTSTT